MTSLSYLPSATQWTDSFRSFILENGVLAVAAGFAFARTLFEVIQSFVSDLFMPAVYLGLSLTVFRLSPKSSVFVTRFLTQTKLNPDHFIRVALTACFVLVSAYGLIEFTRKNFLKSTQLRGGHVRSEACSGDNATSMAMD